MSQPPRNIKIAAYIWYVHAFIGLLFGLMGTGALLLKRLLPQFFDEEPLGVEVFAVAVLFSVIGAAYGALGRGLLKREKWAWNASIGLAFFGLLAVPIGTILGAVMLYLLCKKENVAATALPPLNRPSS